jgi:hypothetical protein
VYSFVFSLLIFRLATGKGIRVRENTFWQSRKAYPALLKAILGTEKAFLADFKTGWTLQASGVILTVYSNALPCLDRSHNCGCAGRGSRARGETGRENSRTWRRQYASPLRQRSENLGLDSHALEGLWSFQRWGDI